MSCILMIGGREDGRPYGLMDEHKDIQTDPYFIIIDNLWKILFATAISGNPALAISRISGIGIWPKKYPAQPYLTANLLQLQIYIWMSKIKYNTLQSLFFPYLVDLTTSPLMFLILTFSISSPACGNLILQVTNPAGHC